MESFFTEIRSSYLSQKTVCPLEVKMRSSCGGKIFLPKKVVSLIIRFIKQKYISLKIKKIEKKYLKYSHSFNEEISSLNRKSNRTKCQKPQISVNAEASLPKKVLLPNINEHHALWRRSKYDFHVNAEEFLPKKVVLTIINEQHVH